MMAAAEGDALVPKLRFPEFRDAGEWGTKLLGSIGQTINGLSGKSGDDFGQGKPFITYKQVFDSAFVDFAKCGLVEIREGENQNEIKRGDILFTTSSETPDEVGYASVVLREPPCPVYLNSFCFSFRPSSPPNELIPEFSGYLFRSPIYRKLVTILAQGSTRFNISKVAFLNLSLPIPQTKEQQKIADCLASVDELITLESQKLDRLKLYKKGLMQQLFPTEGETVPRLRFPEFQGTNEWDINGLGTLTTFVNEKISIVQISLENYISTENILQDYGGITKASKLPETGSVTQFRSNDILFSNIRPYLKKVWLADKKGGASNDVIVIRAKQEIEAKFLSFLLKNDTFINYVMTGAKGVKMPRGDIESMKKYPTPFPLRAEQQKIAECLTSIDDCITVQNQKIETLKTHKKGLMQQLFPVPDGFSAAQAGNT